MRPSTRLTALASVCAAAIALASPPPAGAVAVRSASAAPTQFGAAPALPAGARIVGSLAASTTMHVTVALAPRDPVALQAFADAVSTPGSPEYRQYITPSEFAQRFGATPDQIQAVQASLQAHGLNPGASSDNGLSIPVTASAGTMAQAFRVSFARVALQNGAGAIVNQQAPTLDGGVAPDVQAVLGLNTLSQAKPLLVRPRAATATARLRPRVVTGGPQPCADPNLIKAQQSGGLTADEIASAYGFSGLYQSGDLGAGQTVAVLELEPYDQADIAGYEACYGVNAPIANVPVDGGAGSGSGSGEAALDIENVIGLAPQASIAVYEGPNSGSGPYDTFSAIIGQHIAQVVTASWGQCEFINDTQLVNGTGEASAENTLFQEAAAQGQSIVSASGDEGAEDCFPTPPTAQVDDPASQPYVTGVGGTSFQALGPRPSETVWNDKYPTGASGGGVSSIWKMPTYQSNTPGSLHVINSGSSGTTCGATSGYCREVPDVAADADPATGYVIYWNGAGAAGPGQPTGWQVVGGTSAAAPTWAALIALINASAACHGLRVGFANPALYAAAATGYANAFNDAVTGNNDMTGANDGQFAAGPGYDMATGLGSPNGAALTQTLCTDSIALVNPGAQRSTVNTSVVLQIKADDTRGATVSYSASGLPTGLSINHSSGKITGHPRTIGKSAVTVTASDAAGTTSRISFDWTIQGSPALSQVSLTKVGKARPRLSFMLAAGGGAPELKTVTVTLPRGLSFTRSSSAVTVTGVGNHRLKFTASVQHGTLVVKLRRTSRQVHVTIGYPRLQAGGALVPQVAAHHASRVTLTVRATDALKLTTKLTARVKART
jgi:subtilase family serine protease